MYVTRSGQVRWRSAVAMGACACALRRGLARHVSRAASVLESGAGGTARCGRVRCGFCLWFVAVRVRVRDSRFGECSGWRRGGRLELIVENRGAGIVWEVQATAHLECECDGHTEIPRYRDTVIPRYRTTVDGCSTAAAARRREYRVGGGLVGELGGGRACEGVGFEELEGRGRPSGVVLSWGAWIVALARRGSYQ